MTNQETLQPRSTFIEAGRIACRIGVYFQDNPYKDEPCKSAWEKGHMLESGKDNWRERGIKASMRRRTKPTGIRGS